MVRLSRVRGGWLAPVGLLGICAVGFGLSPLSQVGRAAGDCYQSGWYGYAPLAAAHCPAVDPRLPFGSASAPLGADAAPLGSNP